MQVGTRNIEVEPRNDFVPIQDTVSTKVAGIEILFHSVQMLISEFAMIVALQL